MDKVICVFVQTRWSFTHICVVAYFGIYPDFKKVAQSARVSAVKALKQSKKNEQAKLFIVHRTNKGWGLTLLRRNK